MGAESTDLDGELAAVVPGGMNPGLVNPRPKRQCPVAMH